MASFERTTYDGTGGVDVGSVVRRLAFALRFGEPNMVLSGLIESDSRVLFNRNVKARVEKVAPYLKLDHKSEKKPVVAVLFDHSQSMQLPAGPFGNDRDSNCSAARAGFGEQEIGCVLGGLRREDAGYGRRQGMQGFVVTRARRRARRMQGQAVRYVGGRESRRGRRPDPRHRQHRRRDRRQRGDRRPRQARLDRSPRSQPLGQRLHWPLLRQRRR